MRNCGFYDTVAAAAADGVLVMPKKKDDPKAVMYSSLRCDVLCRYSRQRTVLSAALAIAIRDREQFCDTVAAADGVPVMANLKFNV